MPRVLIVEDSATQAQLLRLLLEAEEFTVAVARDGQSGLAQLRQQGPFDLVLSDIVMPDLSGYELCRQIKADPATRETPVVLLTHLHDPLDILHGLECGADNFLTKPVDGPDLVRRLRGILANKAQAAAGPALSFRGKAVTITADKGQILDLLLTAVEEVARAREREQQAESAKQRVEREVGVLAEAGRRKDEFLSMLAHELRNPLAPILTCVRLARRDERTRERSLDTIERQVRHLTRLVDDLLDASRLAWDKMPLRLDRLDLARLVRTTAEDRRPMLEQAGLQLEVQVAETPVWVKGDATRLAQALTNLLDNAVKFSDKGGQILVRAVAEGGEAWVVVTDHGAGIELDILPNLFRPFAQGRQGLDRSRGGLGLGLTVTRGLVELHGGKVEAASAGPGQGATFTIRLPLQAEPAALTEKREHPSASGNRARILVIEDNRDAADSLRLLLELLGHEVRVAYNGPEGVQTALAWHPAIVLSDLGLPGFDGYEVARRLRRQPELKGALLVALTGYGSEEDRQQSRAAGFDHHLVKPADPSDLERVLKLRVA